MYKRSKFLLVISIIQFLLLIFSFLMFLMDTNSQKYLMVFVLSIFCTILFSVCFVFVFILEKRTLQNRVFEDYKLDVINRDHLQILRSFLEDEEMSNSLKEAELIKKYEELSIEYERKASFYLISKDEKPLAIIEVTRDFKNKTIKITLVKSKIEDLNDIYAFIAFEEKKTLII